MFLSSVDKLKKKIRELDKLALKCQADGDYLLIIAEDKEIEAIELIKENEIDKARLVARESLEKKKMAENWISAHSKISLTVNGLQHMIMMKEYTDAMKKVGAVMGGLNKLNPDTEVLIKLEKNMEDFAVLNNVMGKDFSNGLNSDFHLDDREVNKLLERLCDENSLTGIDLPMIESKSKKELIEKLPLPPLG